MAAIYIHIPFCIRKCRYCDFYSVAADKACIERYLDALLKELLLKGDHSMEISSIYIGGGTPSMLTDRQIRSLLDRVKQCFRLTGDCEVTLEANPVGISYDRASSLVDMGINRLSLGIQGLHEADLSILGRLHSSTEALSALSDAQRAGLRNISVDIIYGIPGQTVSGWLNTLRTLMDLKPQHISTYELTLAEGTEMYHIVSRGALLMPDEDLIQDMYFCAIDMLTGAGYQHYEISNFALSGFQCRHNINYWRRGVYVGLGAGAHSFEGNVRKANASDLDRYMESLNEGVIPIGEATDIDDEEALREGIFLGLRMTEGIDKMLLRDKDGVLHSLIKDGLVVLDDKGLRLTRSGLLLSNEVIVRLLS